MKEVLRKHTFFTDKTIESCTLLEHQGYCNENYLVVADGVKYIVRKLLRTDINRTLEWKILNKVYKSGITAKPILYDELQEIMVFSFLEGTHETALTKIQLKYLSKTLKRLHHISIETTPITLDIKKQSKEIVHAFDTIASYPNEFVLCHNDLNPQNIFFNHEAKLIDFEYAGINDKYFDLASVCVEFKLDDSSQKILLDEYFLGSYTLAKLEAYKIIYSALCKEWFDTLG